MIVYYLCIITIGFASGFLAGLLGIGGGILIIPSLFLLYSFFPHPHHEYISQFIFGTSNGIILINSLKNFHNYYKQGYLDIRKTLKVATTAILGGIVGAKTAAIINSDNLKTIFAIFLIILSLRMFFSKKYKQENSFDIHSIKINDYLLVFIGFVVGFIAGFFGIGGGVVAVPLLTVIFKVPIIYAQGFSVSLIPFNSFGGVIGYISSGLKEVGINLPYIGFVDVSIILICGILGSFTTKIGLNVAKNLKQNFLKKIFALVLMVVALKIIC